MYKQTHSQWLWWHLDPQTSDLIKGKPWTNKQRNTMNADAQKVTSSKHQMRQSFRKTSVPFLFLFNICWHEEKIWCAFSARTSYTYVTCDTQRLGRARLLPRSSQCLLRWKVSLSPQAWGAARKVSKDDWLEWLRRLSVVLLKESSSPALRSCWSLAQTYIPLAR